MASGKTYNTIDCKQTLLLIKAENSKYGGYKRDLLAESLSSTESEYLICVRCNGIMRKACLVGDVQDLACEACVLEGDICMPMAKSRKKIDGLSARCPLKGRGCVWKGKLGKIDTHLNECPEFVVNCSKICGVILQRSELSNHCENECLNREVECTHCKVAMQYKNVEIHITTCPELPLLCPNECMETFLRKGMNLHIENDCPNTLVHCTNECGLKLKRSNLSVHYEDECQLRISQCKYCLAPMQLINIETHFKSCSEFPLICPNECLKSLIRKELDSHIAADCPNTKVACPYKEMGCEIKIKRCELLEHKKTYESNHLDLTILYYSNRINILHTRMRKKDEENRNLTEKVATMEERISEKDKQVEQLAAEVKSLKNKISKMNYEMEKEMERKREEEKENTFELSSPLEPKIKRSSSSYFKDEEPQREKVKDKKWHFGKSDNIPEMRKEHLKIGFLHTYKYTDSASGKWEKNLVALGDGELQFYNKVKDYGKKISASIPVRGCYGVMKYGEDWRSKKPNVPQSCSPENGFVLRIGGASYYLVADNLEDAVEWLQDLEEARLRSI